MAGGGQKRKAANQQPVCGHTDEGKKIAALEKELGRVKKRLKTADEELREYLRISLISKDREIESYKKKVEKVNKDMLLVQSKNSTLFTEKASLEESMEELEANQYELMGSHSKMSSTLSALKEELYHLKNNNSQLSVTNSKLQDEVEQNKETITELQKNHSAIELEYKHSDDVIATLDDTIKELETSIVKKEKQLDKVKNQIEELKRVQYEKDQHTYHTRQGEEKKFQDTMTSYKHLHSGYSELYTKYHDLESKLSSSNTMLKVETEQNIERVEQLQRDHRSNLDKLHATNELQQKDHYAKLEKLHATNELQRLSILRKDEQISTMRKSKEVLKTWQEKYNSLEKVNGNILQENEKKIQQTLKQAQKAKEESSVAYGALLKKYKDLMSTCGQIQLAKEEQSTLREKSEERVQNIERSNKIIMNEYGALQQSIGTERRAREAADRRLHDLKELQQSVAEKNEQIESYENKLKVSKETNESLLQSILDKNQQAGDEHFLGRVADLKAYKDKNGHINVKPSEDKTLNKFISNARAARKNPTKVHAAKLTADRIAWLDALGFEWGPMINPVKTFEERLKELVTYKEEHGHLRIKEKEKSLAGWCRDMRRARRHGKESGRTVTEEQIASLDAIGFIWSPSTGPIIQNTPIPLPTASQPLAAAADTVRKESTSRAVTVTVFKPTQDTKLGLTIKLEAGSSNSIKITGIAQDSLFKDTSLKVGMTLETINGKKYSFDQCLAVFKATEGHITIGASAPDTVAMEKDDKVRDETNLFYTQSISYLHNIYILHCCKEGNVDALSYKAEVASVKESAGVDPEVPEEEEESLVGDGNISAMACNTTQAYKIGTRVSKMFFDEKMGVMRLYDGSVKSYGE